MFGSLVSLSSLVFCLIWPRVLVTNMSSGSVGYPLWVLGGYGSLDPFWSLLRPKSSFEVVEQGMDTRGWDADRGP